MKSKEIQRKSLDPHQDFPISWIFPGFPGFLKSSGKSKKGPPRKFIYFRPYGKPMEIQRKSKEAQGNPLKSKGNPMKSKENPMKSKEIQRKPLDPHQDFPISWIFPGFSLDFRVQGLFLFSRSGLQGLGFGFFPVGPLRFLGFSGVRSKVFRVQWCEV